MGNIKKIAELSGVSVTTVSRVLNNHPYVKEEKRKAVLETIDKLNYSQNLNAVHLSRGKTSMIGVMVPYITVPYYGSLLDGIGEEALKNNYSINLFQTNYDVNKEKEALEKLKSKQVDGMIIGSHTANMDILRKYASDHPIIVCEKVTEENIAAVYIDHYSAFRQGLDFLHSNGYKHIGYCVNRATSANSRLREKAFYEGLQKLGLAAEKEWVFDSCLSIEDGKRVVKKLLELKDRPDALLVSSDQVAAGIMTEARKQQMNIPEDLALLSYDNHPISEALELTTMDLPIVEMGRRSFQLFQQLQDKKQEMPIELKAKLVVRSTV
ncbi:MULTISPECIES: LacI family DNA-binding transcriptional regulator [Bacillaceae]|uniref:LacI family DNA-binding transcriptional regulator n=1 Tax=Bacillaceae TaxID=186817 RepID=UPI001E44CDC8|nr:MULTISPECIES: LacI family DNA-binding transcriptional regulator [Bacillaceae]MCE4051118.1 LacI family DNA-binding transcriptional regulator [Bacillus sp. Au-Bac7]MCM3030277.1 LacI family DNA-binding transcriptional regulator [Niallia sp. MER 6]